MSLILCIETGTDVCSVGIAKDGELLSLRESDEGRDHARKVGVFVDELLRETGIAPEDLDAVVVPLVAFDDDGNRLGYGGGNYDRLLPALRDDAVIAGIAFEEQRVEAVPVEPHDRPLPHIVTA